MSRKKFRELLAHMSESDRAEIRERANKLREEMALSELREAMSITQEHLAKVLHVDQSAISKVERRTDMYLSTLESFIRAMGGRLELRAVFPSGVVKINQFGALRKRPPAAD